MSRKIMKEEFNPILPSEIYNRLVKIFEPEIKKQEKLTGLNLNSWLKLNS